MSIGGLGNAAMSSLLSINTALKKASSLSSVANALESSKRVLAGEIRMDKGRGLDVANKEEELEELNQKSEDITAAIMETSQTLMEKIIEDNEKIVAEEKEAAAIEKRAEEKAGLEKSAATGSGNPSVRPVENTGISADTAAVVEISNLSAADSIDNATAQVPRTEAAPAPNQALTRHIDLKS